MNYFPCFVVLWFNLHNIIYHRITHYLFKQIRNCPSVKYFSLTTHSSLIISLEWSNKQNPLETDEIHAKTK